jgi:hypothetical protein
MGIELNNESRNGHGTPVLNTGEVVQALAAGGVPSRDDVDDKFINFGPQFELDQWTWAGEAAASEAGLESHVSASGSYRASTCAFRSSGYAERSSAM